MSSNQCVVEPRTSFRASLASTVKINANGEGQTKIVIFTKFTQIGRSLAAPYGPIQSKSPLRSESNLCMLDRAWHG